VIRLATAVAFLLLVAPLTAAGQLSDKIARIGMLRSEQRPLDDRIRQNIADVRAGLHDEGYAEGQHYRIDYYAATSEVDVVTLARTLVRDKVDVIHAIASVPVEAAQKATTTIPIVAHDYETDPVAAGFVATLAKPGGNLTGMFLDLPEISGKLLELLKTALPGLRRVGVLWDPLTGKAQVIAVERAAKAMGIELNILEARARSLEQTIRAADRKASALLLLGSPMVAAEFPKIAEATTAARYRRLLSFPPLPGSGASWPTAPTPRISIDRKDE
jgi:putative ABC transport system substrate-binding protein